MTRKLEHDENGRVNPYVILHLVTASKGNMPTESSVIDKIKVFKPDYNSKKINADTRSFILGHACLSQISVEFDNENNKMYLTNKSYPMYDGIVDDLSATERRDLLLYGEAISDEPLDYYTTRTELNLNDENELMEQIGYHVRLFSLDQDMSDFAYDDLEALIAAEKEDNVPEL